MASTSFEEVTVSPAIAAKEAVTKMVMVIPVDRDTAKLLNRRIPLRIYVTVLALFNIFVAGFVWFPLDLQPNDLRCEGECQGAAILLFLLLTSVTALPLNVPLVWCYRRISEFRRRLLKELGWDGESEYRIEIIDSKQND